MPWIESHIELEGHPKTLALMIKMGWDLDQTIGKLHRFWWWCFRYAIDGDLRRYNDSQLAAVVGLNTERAKELVDAMVTCGGEAVSGFLDRVPYFRVHDWWDTAGSGIISKYKSQPAKWQRIRALYEDSSGNSSSNSCSNTTPNQPNQPNQPTDTLPAGAFELVWAKYPSKDGKKSAERHFKASVKTLEDWENLQKALANYLACERVKKGYIKNGSTWFNDWRSWVNPTGFMMGAISPQNAKPYQIWLVNRITQKVAKTFYEKTASEANARKQKLLDEVDPEKFSVEVRG